MAVVPKHPDQNSRYDPRKDMTGEQLHRFGKVANQAHKRRKELEDNPTVISAARTAAFRPVIKPKKDKPNTARYVAWLIVALAASLWAMYMSG
ncbi:hypothetical protein [Vibrio sonorensis]|uniref:hypothetical protein n=1 Tax=Vibrio sonorensis TaxID=1004316 RepID=UPI0008DABF04|nr:hypothetical protein [Vibrio sonorensis]